MACQVLGADGQPAALSIFAPEGRLTLAVPVRRIENVTPGSYFLVVGGGSPLAFTIAEGRVTPLASKPKS